MKRILFVHNHPSRFVQIDLALLREKYDVREWYQRSRWVNLVSLSRAVSQSDLVFGWFASWHTFFPLVFASLLHRPSLLIVGGYDTANLPDIGYGSQRGGLVQLVSRATMQLATCVVAFSEFSRQDAIRNSHLHPSQVRMIYIGVPDVKQSQSAKENLVITVGNVDQDNLQRKGLEPFVRAAALLPEVPFVVIGAWRGDAIHYLRSLAPPNVQFTNYVSDGELEDFFSRAGVYVQASRHEGFGLAVAEAMLHECIPVVTRVGSLPEVVGDTGVYVDSTEANVLAAGIKRALNGEAEQRHRARERIVNEFPLERRREKLYALIDSLR